MVLLADKEMMIVRMKETTLLMNWMRTWLETKTKLTVHKKMSDEDFSIKINMVMTNVLRVKMKMKKSSLVEEAIKHLKGVPRKLASKIYGGLEEHNPLKMMMMKLILLLLLHSHLKNKSRISNNKIKYKSITHKFKLSLK